MNGVYFMKVGEWVKRRGTTRIGIIAKHDEEGKQFFVKWLWEKGERIPHNAVGWVDEIAVTEAPLFLTSEDYRAMVDFALDTKDVTWRNQLVRKSKLTKLSTN
jgi:hypothetical protein